MNPYVAGISNVSFKVGLFALSAATGGAAGALVEGAIGASAAGTWGGTILIGAVDGGVFNTVYDGGTQLRSGNKFSFVELAQSSLEGAAGGALGGVASKAVGSVVNTVAKYFAEDASGAAAKRVSLKVIQDMCFVAGTQVVSAITDHDADESAPPQALAIGGTAIAAPCTRYITQNIEDIKPGEFVITRDELDVDSPMVMRQVEAVFENVAYQLLAVTIRSSNGIVHTLRGTSEHPVYVQSRGWIHARELIAGDVLVEANGGMSTIVASHHEYHPEGIRVYNFRVAETHTYFVREKDSTADPVWVHNAVCSSRVGRAFEQALIDADRLTVREAEDVLAKLHGNNLDSPGLHSVYAVLSKAGEILHIGETGRDILVRFAEHQRTFAKLGYKNLQSLVLDTTEGKAGARAIETTFIKFFRDLGYDLPFNFNNH